MNFADTLLAVESSSIQFDAFYSNCETFIESALNELKESYVSEAKDSKASEGALVKIGKAIKELIKRLKEAITNMVQHITDFFENKKTKETLKKAEELSKNPKFKNVKVEIPDIDGIDKIYDEGINKLDKAESYIKVGKKSPVKVSDIVNDTKEKAKNKKVIVVAVGTLIGILAAAELKFKNDSKATISELDNEAAKFEDKPKKDTNHNEYTHDDTVDDMEEKIDPVRGKINLIHNKNAQKSAAIMRMFNKLKGVFTNSGEVDTTGVGEPPKKDDKDDVEESVSLNENSQEEYLMRLMESIEAESFDANSVLSSIEESVSNKLEVEDILSDIEESVSNKLDASVILEEIEESVSNKLEANGILEEIEESVANKLEAEEILSDIEESVINSIETENTPNTVGEYLESLESELFD